MTKKITMDIECKSCNGTGIYVGIAERDGAGVVCKTCNGTGCQHYTFEYTPFRSRKKRKDIKRVYLSSYGYCISPEPLTLSNGVFVDFSKEGVPYEEFLKGKMPSHIKRMACPMLADQPSCHKIKGFTEKCDELNGGYLSRISNCKCKK
ncbi:MAG: hypothetical protein ACOCRX_01455 [Candidatus Woesearchaeota archaeon]